MDALTTRRGTFGSTAAKAAQYDYVSLSDCHDKFQELSEAENGYIRNHFSWCARTTWTLTQLEDKVPVGKEEVVFTAVGRAKHGSRNVAIELSMERGERSGEPFDDSTIILELGTHFGPGTGASGSVCDSKGGPAAGKPGAVEQRQFDGHSEHARFQRIPRGREDRQVHLLAAAEDRRLRRWSAGDGLDGRGKHCSRPLRLRHLSRHQDGVRF